MIRSYLFLGLMERCPTTDVLTPGADFPGSPLDAAVMLRSFRDGVLYGTRNCTESFDEEREAYVCADLLIY